MGSLYKYESMIPWTSEYYCDVTMDLIVSILEYD